MSHPISTLPTHLRGIFLVAPAFAVALALATVPGRHALGAGFQLNEHSAPATGRVSAVAATVNDPAAVFHNPAGLTGTSGTQVQVGLTLISPHSAYAGPGYPSTNSTGGDVLQSASSAFVPVPNAYVSRALSSKAFVGFGFYSPFGLGITWENPDDFVGRTVIQELSLRTFYLSPAIALKLSDAVSVAVGVSLVPATVYLKRILGATDNGQVLFPKSLYDSEGAIELAGSAFGVGANAGIQVKLIENLRLGFAFRSAVDLAFTGKADFQIPGDAPASIEANFPDQDVTADLTIPHTFVAGVGWVQGPLTVELGGQLTLWESYDELRINFSTEKPAPSSAAPRNWTATPIVRLGGQYTFDEFVARAGVAYDISPVPDSTVDPTLPDRNRTLLTVGFGYDFGSIRADLAYMAVLLAERSGNDSVNFADGTYPGGTTHLLSTSVGAAF